jgi:OmpA-OmpF porin, OOP family
VGAQFSVKLGGEYAAPVASSLVAPVPVAAPAPVVAPPPAPVDSDGDGVVDGADRCPNTAAGAQVDANGCELDGDHDGVVDRLDRCPTTPAGDKVDAVGCSLTMALEVKFDNNSATIKPESNGVLDEFTGFLNAVPSAKGDLEGHTDNVGPEAYNKALSQRRADAVKAYVVAKGVDGSRLNAIGYGEVRPLADNKTAEGRAANRRVLFTRPVQ